MVVRTSAPMATSDPKILADWLERRVGGREATVQFVSTLKQFYDAEAQKKEATSAAATTGDEPGPQRGNAPTYGRIRG
jgi:hypothetical protein